MAKIVKHGHVCHTVGMKMQTLNVNLTVQLRRFVEDQVRDGRY
jgi:hypothetical protein